MIGKMFCGVLAGAMWCCVVDAGLQVSTASSLGSVCYSETQDDSSLVDLRVIECGPLSAFGDANAIPCPSEYNGLRQFYQNIYDSAVCYLGASGGKARFCASVNATDGAAGACTQAVMNVNDFGGWTVSGTRAWRTEKYYSPDFENSGDWSGVVYLDETGGDVWGCKAGYYCSGSCSQTNSAMNCVLCPLSGNSNNGNLDVSGCYLLPDSKFSDDAGSGEYTDYCYHD